MQRIPRLGEWTRLGETSLADTVNPTLTLTAPGVDPTVYAAFNVVIMASKPVTGFDSATDITVINGTATDPVEIVPFDGTTYQSTITPDFAGETSVSVQILAGVCTDLSNNANLASNILSREVDVTYLLDVVFADYADDPAPVASPIVGRSGQLTVVENDGSFSITSGKLAFTAQSTPVFGDQGFKGDTAFVRNAGLVFFTTLTATTVIANNRGYYGFAQDGNLNTTSLTSSSMYALNSAGIAGGIDARIGSSTNLNVGTYTISTEYQYAIVVNHRGAFHFIKGGVLTDWTLLWKASTNTTTPVYPSFINYLLAGSFGLWRVALLPTNTTYPVPALGTRDLDLSTPGTGTGTSSIASPAAGNTFVHTADTLIEFTLTTMPSSGNIDIRFRKQDGSNYWYLRITAAGALSLIEVHPGIDVRATAAGVLSGGEKITLKVNNETITGYYNGTQAWSYASATNFKTATTGEINSLGTGGAITNFTAKTLNGIANLASSNHPGKGLATSVLPGPRAGANTFTHEADCVWEFTLDALPSAGNIDIAFRKQDATHEWILRIVNTGVMALVEDNAGETNRAATGAVLVGNERLTIIASGSTIRGYYNTTLAWVYASATNFSTQTGGNINSLGTGGRVSNLIAWPLNLASAPNTPEAANVSAAFSLMATS